MKTFYLLLYFLLVTCVYSQIPEWVNYTNVQNINVIAYEGDFLWIGTDGGLVKFNRTSGEKHCYNMANSGLPSNKITALAIDNNGNKWIGAATFSGPSGGGLVKFDNQTWMLYNSTNSGLPYNYVTCIAFDINGDKWIGTQWGLAKFDGLNWTKYDQWNSGLPQNDISDIAIDANGTKWIGVRSGNGGLVKLADTTWTLYNTSNSGLPDNDINCLIESNGIKWIGSKSGLARFDDQFWSIYNNQNVFMNHFVTDLAIDPLVNKIWVATKQGLYDYDGIQWTYLACPNVGLVNDNLTAVAVTPDGVKWFGTFETGLTRWDEINLSRPDIDNSNLTQSYINCSAEDKNGVKWFGTTAGLIKFAGIYDNYNNGAVYTTLNSSLPSNNVTSIVVDANNNKWIGTIGGGIVKISGTPSKDETWTIYNTINSNIPANDIYSLALDTNSVLWIGTFYGLVKFDGLNWILYNHYNTPMMDDFIAIVIVDQNNVKWAGSVNCGLFKFDDVNWTIYTTANSGLPLNRISALAMDENMVLWIGTLWGGGLTKFDGINWTTYNGGNSPLPNGNLTAIKAENNGNKWIATFGGGVAKFDGLNWTLYNSTTAPFPRDHISSILIDHNGVKWFSSEMRDLNDISSLTLLYEEGGVPVELNAFSTVCVNNDVNIKWETITETNNYGFELLRDNLLISFVKGNGSTTEKQFYSVEDKNLSAGNYNYKLYQIDFNGQKDLVATSNVEVNNIVLSYQLQQNYPNPFNPITTIKYSIPSPNMVTIKIFDILGTEVTTLINEFKNAGFYEVNFDGSKLSSGTYFYRIKSGTFSETKKLLLLK